MLLLLVLVPWVLTTVGLLAIILLKQRSDDVEPEDDDGFPIDDIHEVIRVAVYDDAAYWVYDNVFYQSEIVKEPDFSTARPIDTMQLSDTDLSKLMVILDELKESERD